jgi:hypothetical protein
MATFQNRVRAILKIVVFSWIYIVHVLASFTVMVMVAFHGSDVDFSPVMEDRPALIGFATAAISFGLLYFFWDKVCLCKKTKESASVREAEQ